MAKQLNEADRLAWGAQELRDRLADLVLVKAGQMTLDVAQKRARQRSRQSGMTPAQSYRAMRDGSKANRPSPQAQREEG